MVTTSTKQTALLWAVFNLKADSLRVSFFIENKLENKMQAIHEFEIGQYRVDVFPDDCSSSQAWDMDEVAAQVISVHLEESRLGNPNANDHYPELISAISDIDYNTDDFAYAWRRSWDYVTDAYSRYGFTLETFDIRSHLVRPFEQIFAKMIEHVITEIHHVECDWEDEYLSKFHYLGMTDLIDCKCNDHVTPEMISTALQTKLDLVRNPDSEIQAIICAIDEMIAFVICSDEYTDLSEPFEEVDLNATNRAEAYITQLWTTNPNVHFVSIYEHSGVCLQHGSGSCRFDSTPGAAMIVCHPDQYDSWFKSIDLIVRGEVYGLVVNWICPEGHEPEDFGMTDREVETDSCWGFWTDDWAELESIAIDNFGLKDKQIPDNWVI